MNQKFTELLKEATKDILTEDTLQAISTAFDEAVNDRVKIHTERALVAQDEEYAKKLEALLEAVDKDHSAKLQKAITVLEHDRTNKLKAVITHYEKLVTEGAKKLNNKIIGQVSDYLDVYINQKIPTKAINEAVRNARATKVLSEMRRMLGVDGALMNESIREAVVDGKSKIETLSNELKKARQLAESTKKDLIKTRTQLFIESRVHGMDERTRRYVSDAMKGKSYEYIVENFDYTVQLFKKGEKERIQTLRDEARTHRNAEVDVIQGDPRQQKILKESVEVDSANANVMRYLDGF